MPPKKTSSSPRKATKEKEKTSQSLRRSPRKSQPELPAPPPDADASDDDAAAADAAAAAAYFVTVAHANKRKKGSKDQGNAPSQSLEPGVEEREGDVESDGSNVRGKERKAKGTYTLPLLTERSLLQWLSANPILWRKSHMEYRDLEQKRAIWEGKAAEMGKSADYLKRWWKGIHDTYVRKLKKTSGQATSRLTDRELWIMEHCAFYKQEARHRAGPLKNVSSC